MFFSYTIVDKATLVRKANPFEILPRFSQSSFSRDTSRSFSYNLMSSLIPASFFRFENPSKGFFLRKLSDSGFPISDLSGKIKTVCGIYRKTKTNKITSILPNFSRGNFLLCQRFHGMTFRVIFSGFLK